MSRPRRKGVLDKLISEATLHDHVCELALLLGVSNRAVYAWDKGAMPNRYFQIEINKLCVQVGLKPIYKPFQKKMEKRNGQERNQRQRIHAM